MLNIPNQFITIVLKILNIILICDEKGRALHQNSNIKWLKLIAIKKECAEILHDLASTIMLKNERY